jgi:dihydrofolate reductase
MRLLTYYVATSLDGYIAGPDGSFDGFLTEGEHIDMILRELPETLPAMLLAPAGITPRNDHFDTVVMGWNTFAVGLPYGQTDPYPHLRQYVCSQTHRPDEVGGAVCLTREDPIALVRKLKAESSTRDIWLCGGAQLAATLRGEIDQLVLKVNPVMFGAGIPLFAEASYQPTTFRLASSRTFASGVMINRYDR